jgi:hypothetical protein
MVKEWKQKQKEMNNKKAERATETSYTRRQGSTLSPGKAPIVGVEAESSSLTPGVGWVCVPVAQCLLMGELGRRMD